MNEPASGIALIIVEIFMIIWFNVLYFKLDRIEKKLQEKKDEH